MPIVGFGVVFLGYSVFYYGLTQVRGHNFGFLDLVIPGKYDPSIPSDDGNAVPGGPSDVPGAGAGHPPAVTQIPGSDQATTSGSAGAGVTVTAPGRLA